MRLPQRKNSEYRRALLDMLERLKPGMWRPDLYTLRHRAIVAEAEALERDGVMVRDGLALVPPGMDENPPDRPNIVRVCFNVGIVPKVPNGRLKCAGRERPEIWN